MKKMHTILVNQSIQYDELNHVDVRSVADPVVVARQVQVVQVNRRRHQVVEQQTHRVELRPAHQRLSERGHVQQSIYHDFRQRSRICSHHYVVELLDKIAGFQHD